MGFGGEERKNEGGQEMSRDDVRNVLDQVLAEREEKSKIIGEFSDLGAKVQEVLGQVESLKKLWCNPDGTRCFLTKPELDAYMQKQTKQVDDLNAKVADVRGLIEQTGQGAKGIAKDWKNMPVEQQVQEIEKNGISHEALLETLKRCSAQPGDNQCNVLRAVLRHYPPEEIFQELSEEKRAGITSVVCTNQECRVQLENEQAIRIYKKDPGGKYRWLDEPKPEKSPAEAF